MGCSEVRCASLSTRGSVFNQGWLGLLVGVVLSVVSMVLGVVLYRRGRRKGRLATEWVGTPLLGYQHANALPPAVTIQYGGQPVPRVGFTDVLLWNAGGDTLRGADVVPASPLRVEVPAGTLILEAGIVYVTRETSGWDVHIDAARPDAVRVTFNYAEPGDGVRLRVVHTGADLALPVRGEVVGMPKGIVQLGHTPLPYTGWRVAFLDAWGEERVGRRAVRLARVSGPVALPALLAVLITGALWSVWRTPIPHTAAEPRLAAVVRAVVLTFGVITYGLVITIIRNHLGVRRGVWGAPSALYGVAPRRLRALE